MTFLAKSLLATVATVATATLALGATAPASAQMSNDRGYDRAAPMGERHEFGARYDDRRGDNPRFAIEQCSRAAVDQARGNARVTRIVSTDRTGDGFRIKGQIVVSRAGNHWGRGNENGSFSCRVDHGRVTDINLHGLRR